MTFSEQLKKQFLDFVESYQKYFLKTFAVAMTFTVMCFVSSVTLVWLDKLSADFRLPGLLNLLFYRYSYNSYQAVDLAPVFSYFFIAIFSLALFRGNAKIIVDGNELSFNKFIETIVATDILVLIGALITACVIDFLLFKLYWLFKLLGSIPLQNYIYYLILHLRKFIPLILFAIAIHWLTNAKQLNVTLRELLCLFFTLWLFNIFAMNFYLWLKDTFLDLLQFLLDKTDLLVLYQSLLSIPIMAFYFVGYYSAMTWWLRTDLPEIQIVELPEPLT